MKKFIMILMAITMLSSCGEKTLIREGKLHIGVGSGAYPPMIYVGSNGNMTGFDIDMINEVAKRLELEPVLVYGTWNTLFSGINNRKFDVTVNAISFTEDRKEAFNLSIPYLESGSAIIVPRNSSLNSIDDFDINVRLGLQEFTTMEEMARVLQRDGYVFTRRLMDATLEPIEEMDAKHADAVLVDLIVALYYEQIGEYKVIWTSLHDKFVAVSKKNNTELARMIDSALYSMFEDGFLLDLSYKWLGQDFVSNLDPTRSKE